MTSLRYRIGLIFYAGASVFMIGWTVLLLLTLPVHYLAGQWRIAWTGFDLALVLLLAAMAWAIWRRRQVALLIMVVTATLLLCDAWFDVTLSWGGSEGWTSLLTAAGCEVPLALAMLARARSLIVRTAAIVAPQVSAGTAPSALHAIPLLTEGWPPAPDDLQ
jgi:hypothetical protein